MNTTVCMNVHINISRYTAVIMNSAVCMNVHVYTIGQSSQSKHVVRKRCQTSVVSTWKIVNFYCKVCNK